MQSLRISTLTMLFALLTTAVPAHAVVIKTSDGNGADTELREDESNTRGGAKDLNTRLEASPTNLEVIAVRFDLTGVDRSMISDAQLDLIVSRTGMPGNNGLDVYGLKSSVAGQDWVEGTTNGVWNAANPFPGLIHDGSVTTLPFNPAEVVHLGTASWSTAPAQGSTVSLLSDTLSSFLHDAGDLATLFVFRQNPASTQMRFASKEAVAPGQTGTNAPFGTGEYAPQLAFNLAPPASHNIFIWEYIDPNDPSIGKLQSTLYAQQGAGLHAQPGLDASGKKLSKAYLVAANLTGATFANANLANADLSGANLTDAIFHATNLTNADLSHANLTNADFRGQYSDTISVLTGANLSGANLAFARFTDVNFSGVDLSGADVRWARLGYTGISLEQLYSTASYQQHDLSGIDLQANGLNGANLAHQNLTNAYLFNVDMTDTDLTGSDVRGGVLGYFLDAAITDNLIRPDGHIRDLDLAVGQQLVVRDYDGNPMPHQGFELGFPIPIVVDTNMLMAEGGTLTLRLDTDQWDSTISFAPGIPIVLGGALELTFAADADVATQVGRTFHIFDWTGVDPVGLFAVSSPYHWDLSKLYTTGEVRLTAIPEPATTIIVIAAAMGLLTVRRRAAIGECR